MASTLSGNTLTTTDLVVDGTTLVTDSTNNRVGIGTATANQKLHIQDTSADVYTAVVSSTTGQAGILLGDTSNNAVGRIVYTNAVDAMYFYTANAERMRIDASGNVGIGTSSPSSLGQRLVVGDGAGNEGISIYTGNTSQGSINFADGTTGIDTYVGKIGYSHSTNEMSFVTSASTRMRIDASGNVLVGTTNTNIAASSTATDEGVVYVAGAALTAARSAGQVADFNRITNDGEIIRLRKDGTTVGSIGTNTSAPYLANAVDVGLRMVTDNSIRPCTSNGSNRDAVIDLGASTTRFNNLNMTGCVRHSIVSLGSVTTGANFTGQFTLSDINSSGRGIWEVSVFGYGNGGIEQIGGVWHLYLMTNPADRETPVTISSKDCTFISTSHASDVLNLTFRNDYVGTMFAPIVQIRQIIGY